LNEALIGEFALRQDDGVSGPFQNARHRLGDCPVGVSAADEQPVHA